jgi:hypothetical protein
MSGLIAWHSDLTCPICKKTYTYSESDINLIYRDTLDPEKTFTPEVYCVNCETPIEVQNLPEDVRDSILAIVGTDNRFTGESCLGFLMAVAILAVVIFGAILAVYVFE